MQIKTVITLTFFLILSFVSNQSRGQETQGDFFHKRDKNTIYNNGLGFSTGRTTRGGVVYKRKFGRFGARVNSWAILEKEKNVLVGGFTGSFSIRRAEVKSNYIEVFIYQSNSVYYDKREDEYFYPLTILQTHGGGFGAEVTPMGGYLALEVMVGMNASEKRIYHDIVWAYLPSVEAAVYFKF